LDVAAFFGPTRFFAMSDPEKDVNTDAKLRAELDRKLSQRFIHLDPGGYFIIYLDSQSALICAKHYTNLIDDRGLALDPATGKPIPTRGKVERVPSATFTGRTAKELCIKIFEEPECCLVTKLDHAAYLGREFMRAEYCLEQGVDYIQD
jgi:dihydropteroate synthase